MVVWRMRDKVIRTVVCCIALLQLCTFISVLISAVLTGDLASGGLGFYVHLLHVLCK